MINRSANQCTCQKPHLPCFRKFTSRNCAWHVWQVAFRLKNRCLEIPPCPTLMSLRCFRDVLYYVCICTCMFNLPNNFLAINCIRLLEPLAGGHNCLISLLGLFWQARRWTIDSLDTIRIIRKSFACCTGDTTYESTDGEKHEKIMTTSLAG